MARFQHDFFPGVTRPALDYLSLKINLFLYFRPIQVFSVYRNKDQKRFEGVMVYERIFSVKSW